MNRTRLKRVDHDYVPPGAKHGSPHVRCLTAAGPVWHPVRVGLHVRRARCPICEGRRMEATARYVLSRKAAGAAGGGANGQ